MNTIEAPKGIRFADKTSKTNYQKAMAGTPGKYGLNPMIVISSPGPGTGKSLLAHHILKHRFGEDPAITKCPETESEWAKMLSRALEARYLFLDNIPALVSRTLAAFLTSPKSLKEADVNVQVIVTSNGAPISLDLENRSLFIELSQQKESRC